MNQFASFIPQNSPLPDPPESRIVGLFLSSVAALTLLAIIVFISVEWIMDLAGNPIRFEERSAQVPPDEIPEERPIFETDALLALVKVLSPRDGARILEEELTVLCTWSPPEGYPESLPINMQLWVDDFLVPWDMHYGKNTWMVTIRLGPGEHRVRTAVFESEIFVGDRDVSEQRRDFKDWKTFRMHPDLVEPSQCDRCHQMLEKRDELVRRGHEKSIGPWKGSQTCLSCHPVEEFEANHSHIFQPLQDCRLCHAVHGAFESDGPLLKEPRKEVCGQCHEVP